MLLALVGGAFCFWQSGLGGHGASRADASIVPRVVASTDTAQRTLKTLPIAQIRPGLRVLVVDQL